MKFMPWNKEMGITYAQYRRQVDQELNSWLAGLELSASTLEYRPGPVIRPPGLEQTGPSRPPGLHPSKPGYIQPGRPDPRSINTRPWLGIRRKQQYGYDSALKQREYSKGKPGKKKRGNNKPLTPKPGQKPRHNLLGIAQTLNL